MRDDSFLALVANVCILESLPLEKHLLLALPCVLLSLLRCRIADDLGCRNCSKHLLAIETRGTNFLGSREDSQSCRAYELQAVTMRSP